jgi:hypothetical protein
VNAFVLQWRNFSTSVASFVYSVAARFTWRALVAALVLAATSLAFHILMARYCGYMSDAQYQFMVEGAIICTTMGITSILALLCADEATRRGVSPVLAYCVSLLLASAFSGFLQLQLRAWWILPPIVGHVEHLEVRVLLNELYMALDTLIWGGFGMLVYTHRQRELRCRALVESLQFDRLKKEQELARSRLVATQAQVEPALLLTMLDRIKASYETASDDAEPQLEELIAHLRDRLKVATSAVEAPPMGVHA